MYRRTTPRPPPPAAYDRHFGNRIAADIVRASVLELSYTAHDLGFEGPGLVVQVKSGDVIADQPALQELLGCVQDTHADQGLLVSWNGFKPTVRKRINDLYFRGRLWGRDEIVSALFEVYPRLPETIRAELPLRPIWTLVADGEPGGLITSWTDTVDRTAGAGSDLDPQSDIHVSVAAAPNRTAVQVWKRRSSMAF